MREALTDVILLRLEPYKDIKPSVINANKVNEMLNITLRNFMDDMKIEDMNREDLHDLCGSFRFLLSKRCPIAYSANYSEYLKDVKEQGIKDYADEIVALYTLVEQYQKY